MSDKEYVKVPRVSIEVTEELARRFEDAIPWGVRSKVMSIVIEDLLDLIDREGNIVTAALLNRVIKVDHVIKYVTKKEGDNSGTS